MRRTKNSSRKLDLGDLDAFALLFWIFDLLFIEYGMYANQCSKKFSVKTRKTPPLSKGVFL
jgi:hypothetical protein